MHAGASCHVVRPAVAVTGVPAVWLLGQRGDHQGSLLVRELGAGANPLLGAEHPGQLSLPPVVDLDLSRIDAGTGRRTAVDAKGLGCRDQ